MQWNLNYANLRNTLAGLYWNIKDITRLAIDTGLKPQYLNQSDKAINYWQSVIEEAIKQKLVDKLIDCALEEYPENDLLRMARNNELLAVETPLMSDTQWTGPTVEGELEQIIGSQNSMLPINFLSLGMKFSKSVCRVVLSDNSRGTGFLINDNLLVTNNHVIGSEEEAGGAKVEFNFQKTVDGKNAPVSTYSLLPNKEFITSPREKQGGDDWTIVKIDGNPNSKWGEIPVIKIKNSVSVGSRATIIQHPGGGQKHIAFYHNIVVASSLQRIHYLTDTLEGSSGSPVFDNDWRLIAVHNRGGVHEPNSKQNRWRNQGIHINLIYDALKSAGKL
ncbi:MAG: trypsin-like peptidase domain-containing protein [Calditrichia bacterium]